MDATSAPSLSSVQPFPSLPHLFEHHARHRPDAAAILAPGRAALTYAGLQAQVDAVGRTLRAAGIGRQGRVAIVMPNGAEMAVAILAVATHAVCAPINPAYAADELGRYLDALRVQAVILQAGQHDAARETAQARGLPILELAPAPNRQAGSFTLAALNADPTPDRPVPDAPARPGDPALLFLTSGTTSRPKVVRLTHANICTAAAISRDALRLEPADRCMNVMPLFHGHGLIGVVLTSLGAGGSVVCTPGCDVERVFDWLADYAPTRYSAVPTMHQAILAAARRRVGKLPRLRFIRSASAPLSPCVVADMEALFGTCLIDTYAMMEAGSAPVACHGLPPCRRKPGSVGSPVGLDVAIMDPDGTLLPRGRSGEIVVRGPTVMDGYDGDEAATANAFVDGWFRTGDLGVFDADGDLFLTGRAKEIVNRGGEKIAPLEIDEALLQHPAVAEAVSFPVPHPTLGEDIAAAIVLQPGASVTAQDLRRFVSGRVSDFKVPSQVLIMSAIPKGPTGKVQRIGLAERLGLGGCGGSGFAAPRTPLETALAASWREILQLERVGIHDSFFALGGDSLSAVRALAHADGLTRRPLDISRFLQAPTIAETARQLEAHNDDAPLAASIPRADPAHGAMASAAQDHLRHMQRLLPGLPFFNLLYPLRITSPVDPARLADCFNEIVRRHGILRTTFAEVGGHAVQIIASELSLSLDLDDLADQPAPERDAAAYRILQTETLYRFDLAHGPLLRLRLLRLGAQDHLLLINTHQIVTDGWSFGVLVGELVALYDAFTAGSASPLAPLPLQFADVAQWQQQWRSHPDMVAQLEYWRERLDGSPPAMQFGAGDRAQPTDGQPGDGQPTDGPPTDRLLTAKCELVLPASLLGDVKRLSHREGGTLFMALVAALKTVLHRQGSHDDLWVATQLANRNRPGTERLIGPLANTVILRTDLSGAPGPLEVMRRVRATIFEAFAHQDLPFEVLGEALERERGIKPDSLAQVMIMLHNASLRPIAPGTELTLEEAYPSMLLPLVTASTFDITLIAHESEGGLTLSCVYRPNLSDKATIDRLLIDFRSALEQLVLGSER
ncbi:MAG: hypothetical protein NVSMB18_32030 [Acetobacteraceae bacterium]